MINFIEKLKKFQAVFESFNVCFDFGTSYTRIAIKDIGIILEEPTVLAYNVKNKNYVFFGKEAKKIIGKTPDFIQIIKPINNSIIGNFDAQLELVNYFFNQSINYYLKQYKLIKPRLTACVAVPTAATEIEKRAVEELLYKLNFSEVFLIDKPVANAFGAGFNPLSHQPILIVDLGGGLIEAAIVSGGGVVSYKTSKNAGDYFNNVICNYIHLKHGVIIGETTAEDVKEKLLSFEITEKINVVRGKSLENGLPKTVRIKSIEIKEALSQNLFLIIDLIKEIIEISPPEVVDDVYTQGVFLCGGLAKIPQINQLITKEIKINVNITNHPQDVTIHGLLKIIKDQKILKKISLLPI